MIEYKIMAGMLTAIILTGTASIYIIDDPEAGYKNCIGGWEINHDTGMHDCHSRNISEWCFKLSDSGYRCYLGKIVEPPAVDKCETTGNNKYWICYSEGKETYLGEL